MTLNRIQFLTSVIGLLLGGGTTFLVFHPPMMATLALQTAVSLAIVAAAVGSWRSEHPELA